MKKFFLAIALLCSITTTFAENKPQPTPDDPPRYFYVYICDDGRIQTASSTFPWSETLLNQWIEEAKKACNEQTN